MADRPQFVKFVACVRAASPAIVDSYRIRCQFPVLSPAKEFWPLSASVMAFKLLMACPNRDRRYGSWHPTSTLWIPRQSRELYSSPFRSIICLTNKRFVSWNVVIFSFSLQRGPDLQILKGAHSLHDTEYHKLLAVAMPGRRGTNRSLLHFLTFCPAQGPARSRSGRHPDHLAQTWVLSSRWRQTLECFTSSGTGRRGSSLHMARSSGSYRPS